MLQVKIASARPRWSGGEVGSWWSRFFAMRPANHATQRSSMAYARDHPLERHLNWADEIIFYGRGGLRSNRGDAQGG